MSGMRITITPPRESSSTHESSCRFVAVVFETRSDEETLLQEVTDKAEPWHRLRWWSFGGAFGLLLLSGLTFGVYLRIRAELLRNAPRGLSLWPENTTSYEDPAYRAVMMKGCGEICNTAILGRPSKFFNETRKQIDCMALYSNRYSDAPVPMWPSPYSIPAPLLRDFATDGTAWVHDWIIEEPDVENQGQKQSVWTQAEIEVMKEQALKDQLPGKYGWSVTSMIWKMLTKHADRIRGKHTFVIGSERPWLESQLLALGAGHVTTIDHGIILSTHPNVSTLTPAQVREKFLESNGTEPRFDVAVTFSSLEHAGLGRYGDILNPWADLQAVAKAWCITESGGSMFLGVPSSRRDEVCWNAHRSYGLQRWPHLVANYRQLDAPAGGMWRDDHPSVSFEQQYQPCQFFQPMLAFERMDAPL